MVEPWITADRLKSPHDPNAAEAIANASMILYLLSGQKYPGITRVTEQYACETNGAPVGCTWDSGRGALWNPSAGAYLYITDRAAARYTAGNSIRLRGKPVRKIESVSVGGSALDPTEYRVVDNRILTPTSSASWGACSLPVVDYWYGAAPPLLGQAAAIKLANEFVLLYCGSSECSLPEKVTSVSRQGINFQMFDPQDFIDKGRLGVYEIDLFLASVNPGKALKRAKVFSPDQPRGYRQPE